MSNELIKAVDFKIIKPEISHYLNLQAGIKVTNLQLMS